MWFAIHGIICDDGLSLCQAKSYRLIGIKLRWFCWTFNKAWWMEHSIERVENREWKTDHNYKLVHWHKRDFASIIPDRTQAKYWQRVVWLLLWSNRSYFTNRLFILVLFVGNISTQTILSGWWTHESTANAISFQHKTCTNSWSFHDILGHWISDSP